MTIPLPDKEEQCGNCGHAYEFHHDLDGSAMPCGDRAMKEWTGQYRYPSYVTINLCGCLEFIQTADPEEFMSS
jgi:hypothetical protein